MWASWAHRDFPCTSDDCFRCGGADWPSSSSPPACLTITIHLSCSTVHIISNSYRQPDFVIILQIASSPQPYARASASMSSSESDMMNHQTAKRYSCDRCRDQKLRCTRNPSGDSTCDRCLRLGARCVTSSGRPLGRHPLQLSQPSLGNAHSSPPLQHGRPSRTPGRRGLRISTASDPLPSPENYPASNNSGSDSSGMSTFFAPAPPQCDVMLNMRMNEPDFLPTPSSLRSSGLAFSAAQTQFSSTSTSLPDLDFGNMEDIAKSLTKSVHHPMGDADEFESGQSETSVSRRPMNGDSITFLTGMIGNISRHLVELRNQSWESWASYLTRAALFDGHDASLMCSGPIGRNPLDSTLWITSRLAWILQTMAPPHFSTASSTASPPTLSMTLMLLSTYIQVGELFFTILTPVSKYMQEMSGRAELASLAMPAGTRTEKRIPARLHIMMMIQAFEQQLHTIECRMGFPPHHRLWGWQDTSAGILDQEESSVLTQALMGQVQETFHSLKRLIDGIQLALQSSSFSSSFTTHTLCDVIP